MSKYKGVYWEKRYRKWCAAIWFEGRNHYLGSFDVEIEAAKAYDRKAVELFGEFAYLNFPEIATGEAEVREKRSDVRRQMSEGRRQK
jgi:hypothetical protein